MSRNITADDVAAILEAFTHERSIQNMIDHALTTNSPVVAQMIEAQGEAAFKALMPALVHSMAATVAQMFYPDSGDPNILEQLKNAAYAADLEVEKHEGA